MMLLGTFLASLSIEEFTSLDTTQTKAIFSLLFHIPSTIFGYFLSHWEDPESIK